MKRSSSRLPMVSPSDYQPKEQKPKTTWRSSIRSHGMVQVHPGFGVLLSNFRFADGTADQAAKEQAIGWAIDQLKAALNDVSKVSLSGAWQPADEQKHVVDAMRGNQ